MMQRRLFLISALAGSLAWWVAMSAASAAERNVFDAASFEAAQERGARILVDISATWCRPARRRSRSSIRSPSSQRTRISVIFSVDFDGQKPIVRKFRAQSQSTLIAFRGKTETARSVGDTDPSSIAALVQSTSAK
jgi:thioredoxin 1